MGSVVWPDTLQSENPAVTTFGGYEKYARQSSPSSVAHQHHHHFHYPSGVFHTLGNLAEPFTYKGHDGGLASWTPDSDVRETKTAYHIEIEVPGVSDKKAVHIAWLSPRILQVEGAAVRPDLARGRDQDDKPKWESGGAGAAANGETKKAHIGQSADTSAKSAQDSRPCQKCADNENEMTTRIIHGERKIGSWRRLYTLPVGCDMTTLKAKLDAGLLQVSVLKQEGLVGEGMKSIEIE